MPYLPIAVRDMLKQRLADGAPLELLVAFDGGMTVRSKFCWRCGGARRQPRARRNLHAAAADFVGWAVESRLSSRFAPEAADHLSFAAAADAPRPAPLEPPSVAEGRRAGRAAARAAACRRANRGQGAAMSLALRARAARSSRRWSRTTSARATTPSRMVAALDAHLDWDGVSCAVELVGWERPGMAAYVAWQNSLATPEQMAAERFVEIPALHQAALFRRRAVDAALAASTAVPRRPAGAEPAAPGDALDTPVDLWWWLAFDLGLRCGKLEGPPLLGWRQHPRQHTRTHGRLALDQLRKVRHFLLRAGGARTAPRRSRVDGRELRQGRRAGARRGGRQRASRRVEAGRAARRLARAGARRPTATRSAAAASCASSRSMARRGRRRAPPSETGRRARLVRRVSAIHQAVCECARSCGHLRT